MASDFVKAHLVGRHVAHENDPQRSPFVVIDVAWDERGGRWMLLVVDDANGRITTWNARESYLLPEQAA